MAYTPTTWASGDTIDATKLNKIEQGIASAGNMPLIKMHTTALSTKAVHFAYATYNSSTGQYDVVQTLNTIAASGGEPIWAVLQIVPYGNQTWYITNLQVPNNELYLLYVWTSSTITHTFSGNIGSSDVTVNFGSLGSGRVITGDCEITAIFSN